MAATLDAPFFSIILPVFNGEKFILETIQSVLAQSFTLWELIVVDDGSTDRSANIVQDYINLDPRIQLLQQPNGKQAAARNTGIKVAAGQWIAFIDADDLWLPAKLELQYQYIDQHPEVDVIFSDGYTKFADKRIRHYYHYPVAHGTFKGNDLYKMMLFGNYIPVLSAVIKSSLIPVIGMQDEIVPGVEDHDYWLRLCRADANFHGMTERLFVYNIHDSNFSADVLNQSYLSSIIRLKNFDARLLDKKDIRKFKKAIEAYLKYFQREGKTEWVQNVKAKFDNANITSATLADKLENIIHALDNRIRFYFKKYLWKFLWYLVKFFYFYPKRKFSLYEDKLAISYSNWLNGRSGKNDGSIHQSAKAKINFFNRNGSKFDVQSIYIGDYSIINFIHQQSGIIAGADVNVGKFCNFNIVGQLIIGNNVLFNNHSTLTCHEEIVIGDNSWFGEGVKMYDHSHKYKDRNIPFTNQGYSHGRIQIGNNVWVGSNSVILQNVTIGDGCVIGANNVIYKSLPPNSIVKSKSMEMIDIVG